VLACAVRIVSWNINGIRAVHRKELFDPFIEALDADVICLQEIKAEQAQFDYPVAGYHEYWHPAKRKGYSGTALFSKVPPLRVTYGLPAAIVKKFALHTDPVGNANDEGRVITAEFDDVYVVTVYTPNAKGDLSRLEARASMWDPAFRAHVIALQKKKPVVFCGDLNVAHTDDDLANPKGNRGKAGFTDEERVAMDEFLAAGFVDTFRLFTQGNGHYTWWSAISGARARNAGWRIDYFLASQSLVPHIAAAEIHADIMGSDHCPVSLTLRRR
jgi:exodeoxyribonuclease-3